MPLLKNLRSTLVDPDTPSNVRSRKGANGKTQELVFSDEQVLVSRKAYVSWQEIQAEFDDYKASVGPWDAATTASWLEEEYDLMPSAEEQIGSLMSSDQTVRTISFATK